MVFGNEQTDRKTSTMTYYLHNNKLFEIDRMPPEEGEMQLVEWAEFNQYLSTLQPIPHELTGEGIVVEGKDFEWRYEVLNVSGNWKECEEWEHAGCDPDNRRRVAVPIEAKPQTECASFNAGDECMCANEGYDMTQCPHWIRTVPQEESLLDIAKSMYESAKKILEQLKGYGKP